MIWDLPVFIVRIVGVAVLRYSPPLSILYSWFASFYTDGLRRASPLLCCAFLCFHLLYEGHCVSKKIGGCVLHRSRCHFGRRFCAILVAGGHVGLWTRRRLVVGDGRENEENARPHRFLKCGEGNSRRLPSNQLSNNQGRS